MMRMSCRFVFMFFSAAAVALVSGCVPRAISWSSDGQRGCFVSQNDLYIIRAPGFDAPVKVAEQISAAVWIPGTHRLLTVRSAPQKTWAGVKEHLDPSHAERIAASADQLLESLRRHGGDLDAMKDDLVADDALRFMYLRDKRPDDLLAAVKSEEAIESLRETEIPLHVIEMRDASAGANASGKRLWATVRGIHTMRPARSGKHVLVVLGAFESFAKTSTMVLLSAETPGEPPVVAENVSHYPDWSADGRWVYYAQSNSPLNQDKEEMGLSLGRISRTEVLDDGKVRDAFTAEEMAGIVFWDRAKVRCLEDGRILFSAMDIAFPHASRDDSPKFSIFELDPERRATVVRVLTQEMSEACSNALTWGIFEISPDESRILAPHDEKGLAAFAIARGEMSHLLPELEIKLWPTWRTNEEISFARPSGPGASEEQTMEVVLMNVNTSEVEPISTAWPEELVRDLVDAKEGQPAPTTTKKVESKDQ